MAEDQDNKRFPHQRLIKKEALKKATERLKNKKI